MTVYCGTLTFEDPIDRDALEENRNWFNRFTGAPGTDVSGRCEWWLRPLDETEELFKAPFFGICPIYGDWREHSCAPDAPYIAVRPALWVSVKR